YVQNVPPRGERMQCDTEVAEDFFALGEDVVEKEHEDVLDDGTGAAQRLAEIHLAASIGGHVFDQQNAIALFDAALDLRVAAKPFALFPSELHRQHHAIGHPRRKWNARRLAAGNCVEFFETDIAEDRSHAEIDQRPPYARKGNEPPAIGIDRARP